ncbi:MAG: glycosyltransferase [Candidatus Brocadia sp.]|nr:glycosyltransferase [Candidatus Brocadia sp.]
MPKVSIITPSYNHVYFLPDRVSSILVQTFDDFEWIIIDDCSTDDSAKILKRLTAHDPRVKLFINEKNMGMAATTKKAIELSSGKYVYRAESDDTCHPRFLERMVRVLDDNPNVGFVFCSSLHIDRNGNLWGGWNQEKKDYIRPGVEIFKSIVFRNNIPGCNIVFSRKAHDSVGGFGTGPFNVACDWHFCLRVCLHFDVGYVAESLGYHRTHDANLSSRLGKTFNLDLFFREGYELLQDIFASIPEKHVELHDLRSKALRSMSLSNGSSLYVKALLNGRWDIVRQIKEGIEYYDPGATRGLSWIKACMWSVIWGSVYHSLYTPISRALDIRKIYCTKQR